jgi:transposase-like protein
MAQTEKPTFDYQRFREEALAKLQQGQDLGGKDGILTPLIKDLLEAALQGELTAHLSASRPNRSNGKSSKQVKTAHGAVAITTPRDREGSFSPQILPKRQTTLGEGLDNKILSLYSKGMSYSDIRAHLEELYGLEVSEASLTAITDKILPVVESWRSRPLEAIYSFVWMDAIHFKVRENSKVVSKAAYTVLGVNLEGYKELLGIYIAESESARLWLSVLSDLQSRGVEDLLVVCIDNLTGFADAIESIFPQAEVQLCLVHQMRNSLRYVTTKDQKAVSADLQAIYRASSLQAAEAKLVEFVTKWGDKYPLVGESWQRNWSRLTCFFNYPPAIRKVIYTTNTVEGFHRQLRQVTKTKGVFSNEMALIKLLYLVQDRISEKWSMPLANWSLTLQQLSILFGERVKARLKV